MTVSVAWIRRVGACEELVFVADSRLSGGRTIDYCPKILTLPRSDCIISFAGDTDVAYPLMLQLSLAIDSYQRARTRALDIRTLRTHVVKIFNSMADAIRTPIATLAQPEVSFIFGGYSWIYKSFEIWHIRYNRRLKRFVAVPARNRGPGLGKIIFGGDRGGDAEHRLIQLLRGRHGMIKGKLAISGLDFEPFEVVRDMLRESGSADSIGGAPQVAKVYQHMNAQAIGVFWPDRESNRITVLGRPVLGYESVDRWILDPDTLRTSHPSHSLGMKTLGSTDTDT